MLGTARADWESILQEVTIIKCDGVAVTVTGTVTGSSDCGACQLNAPIDRLFVSFVCLFLFLLLLVISFVICAQLAVNEFQLCTLNVNFQHF